MGLLHHANYLAYFEIGRTELLRAAGGNYRQMEADGLFAVVVRADVRYQKPARYDDVVTVRTNIVRVTPAKIEHEYLLLREAEQLARASVTLALVDRNGAVQRTPHWMRTAE